ncbi:MAG: hypothetical protein KC636_39745 [Myxococcales bacterium]|nr:hypothetical protein [Myxococcales bacterium]
MAGHESITAFFARYAEAFERLDVPGVVDHFWLPCSFVGNAGVVTQHDRDGLEALIAGLMGKYRSIEFGKVTSTSLRAEILSARLHEVRIHWEIGRRDGSPLYDFDTIYVLANYGKGHRITTVLVVNEAERYQALLEEIAGDQTYVGVRPGSRGSAL